MHDENITQGVKCVVNTCHYYKNGDLCTAGKIEMHLHLKKQIVVHLNQIV